jgi:hypothetical protein
LDVRLPCVVQENIRVHLYWLWFPCLGRVLAISRGHLGVATGTDRGSARGVVGIPVTESLVHDESRDAHVTHSFIVRVTLRW